MITAFAFQPEIWLIFGLILILGELLDGSAIFFLPLGVGAVLLSLWLYLFNEGVIPASWMSAEWYVTLLIWAVLALLTAVMISNWKKMKAQNNKDADKDINDY